ELVAVAAKGKAAVTIDQENRLRVWDLPARRLKWLLPETVPRRLDPNWGAGVAIAPEGNLLAVVEQSTLPGHTDNGIRIWSTEAGTNLAHFAEHRQIRCLEFSPDGKILAVGDGGASSK